MKMECWNCSKEEYGAVVGPYRRRETPDIHIHAPEQWRNGRAPQIQEAVVEEGP